MSKYIVDSWNNFCRVFELPDEYPKEYCFNGGHDVTIKMVDWFNPVPDFFQPAISRSEWQNMGKHVDAKEIDIDELCEKLIPWMQEKKYIKDGKQYLILFSFGASVTFTKQSFGSVLVNRYQS